MAMRDPWLVGGGKSVESLPPLYKCAEAIFGDEGHIADNDAVAAKQGLEDLNAMARTAVTPPTLI
jgi:hypothetical protein